MMDASFDKYLGLNVKMLGCMGLAVSLNNRKINYKYFILEKLPTLLTTVLALFELFCRFQSITRSWNNDFSFALQMLSFLLSSFICAFKGFRIAMAINSIRSVLPEMAEMWQKYPPREHRLKARVLSSAARSLLFSKLYFFHVVLGIGIAAPPVLKFFSNCFTSEVMNEACDLTVRVYLVEYPFEINSRLLYFVILVKEEWMFFNSAFYWACCDTLYIQFVTHVILQLKILKFDINDVLKHENDEKQVTVYLIGFIKRHQVILRFCHQIEKIFSPVLFVAMITSSVNICLAIFGVQEIFKASNYNDIATYMFILAGVTYQMLLYCIYADSLTQEAMLVANAAYGSDWVDKNHKLWTYLRVLMLRSQVPVNFTALGFFTISLRRLTMISKGAVSYFAMLSARHS
ncbi:odorant receptor 67c-like [Copidosoma floridanum]|uniref:odorant receptor 67c-like n=1 Tax=Copidosoma floridanum TaxID=29053 RepID=UPI0006C95DF5|nr:odorant receptor 67c-like [Copidosoma floridanum]